MKCCACLLLLCLAGCGPTIYSQEPPGGYIANGDSVLVDDGRCPAGQVSRVTGPVNLMATRTYSCVRKPSSGWF